MSGKSDWEAFWEGASDFIWLTAIPVGILVWFVVFGH